MTKDEALDFLGKHQPLPPTSQASADDLFKLFDEARKLFEQEIDVRALPLLIGALGEGDGHGTYQLLGNTLKAYPEERVIKELEYGLKNQHSSVRAWSAELLADYPREELLRPLVNLFKNGNADERASSILAIIEIDTDQARNELKNFQSMDLEDEVRKFLQEMLEWDGSE